MELTEEKIITKLEMSLAGSNDIFIQENTNILRGGEVISTSIHRHVVDAGNEEALARILGVQGVSAKITELLALINNE